METNYIRETNLTEKSDKEKKEELLNSIYRTEEVLRQSHKNLEYADGDLIDYYIYRIKANQSKLNYLLKTAKIEEIIKKS